MNSPRLMAMLLFSPIHPDAVSATWCVRTGWALLALSLHMASRWVIKRQGWFNKAVGGVILLGAVGASLVLASLLLFTSPDWQPTPPPPTIGGAFRNRGFN